MVYICIKHDLGRVLGPWLPTLPGTTEDVGVSGMINQTCYLLLDTGASLADLGPLVVLLISHQNRLKCRELATVSMAQLQINSILYDIV